MEPYMREHAIVEIYGPKYHIMVNADLKGRAMSMWNLTRWYGLWNTTVSSELATTIGLGFQVMDTWTEMSAIWEQRAVAFRGE
jgi:hypothetical protein